MIVIYMDFNKLIERLFNLYKDDKTNMDTFNKVIKILVACASIRNKKDQLLLKKIREHFNMVKEIVKMEKEKEIKELEDRIVELKNKK